MMVKQADKAQIDLNIEEINDWDRIMQDDVLSIPTVRVNSHINLSLKDEKNINSFIQTVNASILKEENYGTMNKILVPVDFSPASKNAFVYAQNIAAQTNGVLRLIHCYRPSVTTIDGTVVVSNMSETQARQELKKFKADVTSSWPTDVNQPLIEESFVIGFATDEILSTSKKQNDDIIVIGSTGTSESKKIWGSISSDIALQSESPVILVPKNSQFSGIRKLMYAASSMELDEKMVDKLSKVLKSFNTTIDVVHVADGLYTPFEDEYLEMWTKAFPNRMINFSTISKGNVSEKISNFAKENGTDLLVLTKSKQNFFQSLFHTSVTRSMTLTAEIPILILHES